MRARVPLALALIYVLTGCRVLETKVRTISGVPSPDGTKVAFLFREEPPGGALIDDSFVVSIKDAGDLTNAWEGGEVVWSAEELWPLYLLWVDDHSLEVLLSPGTKDMKAVRTPSRHYSVTTRILRTTLKSEVAGPQATETP